MDVELLQVIERVRRAMPRNVDVMLICDELEKALRTVTPQPAVTPTRARFDRRTYMAQYMRKRRAAIAAAD